MLRRFLLAGLLAGSLTAGAAAPAAAQPQSGLVNVDVSGVIVQLPVAIAANVCDVNVAVLVDELRDDAAECDATGTAIAVVEPSDRAGGGGPQEGLVNVRVSDVTVQVPIAVAANICDVTVAVLAGLIDDDAAHCVADASSDANA